MASLEAAHEALTAGAWRQAASAFRAIIDQTDDPVAHEGLAQVAWWLDDGDTCLTARETAYRIHRAREDSVGAARAATALAADCLLFGRGESVAMGWLGHAQDLLTAVGECPEHGWCAVREAELDLAVRQDPGLALHCAERAEDVGRRTGDGDLCVVGLALQGLTDTVGRLADSQRTTRTAAVVQLCELRRRQGRFEEAEAFYKQAEFDPVAGLGRALIRFATGDQTGAWASVQRLLRTLPPEDRLARVSALLTAVRIAQAVGEHDAADRAAEELRATAAAVRTDALLAMSAMADSVIAESTEVSSLLHVAVRLYHRAGLRHDEAEARVLLATSLLEQGDADSARDQITAATDIMTVLADTAGLARAREFARLMEGHSSGLLTPREKEVLRLISRGLSNDEIATTLTLSPHTVHRHVANILTKLEVPTRTAAVTHGLTKGFI